MGKNLPTPQVLKGDTGWDAETAAPIIAEFAAIKGGLIPALHALQNRLGYIDDAAVPDLAKAFTLSRAEVHGVISFYHDFRREPPPKHSVKLCRAEACQSMGSEAMAADLIQRAEGQHECEVSAIYCLGLCAMAPSAMIDGKLVARLTPAKLDAHLAAAGIGFKARTV
ncbi:MAG: NAD(P)H-dependent oxidoreductase subunit E [Candidatus Pacebacteria bacterium]|nr:NAD(P)H-dependent oxidoreductase subunit E [Candidatus Paceibacterota bacterium]